MSNIKMYGTPTCKDCVIAKEVFQELGTDYEFINIGTSQEATERAIELNNEFEEYRLFCSKIIQFSLSLLEKN